MRIQFNGGVMDAGGAERVACVLANQWAARGHEVQLVMTFLQAETSFYPLDERVDCQPLSHWLPLRCKPLEPWLKWRAIRAIHANFQPDVVLSFLTNVNVNVLLALAGSDSPVVGSVLTQPAFTLSAVTVL